MNFRTILRETTRPEHNRLDTMFSALDIAQPAGLQRFIGVHLSCFRTMSSRALNGSHSHSLLSLMVCSLALDVEILGGSGRCTINSLPANIDPLAIDYLVAGSRLGSKVLYKRWSISDVSIVRRANNYFGLATDPSFWQLTCTALADIDPNSARADAIVQDTKILFELFSTAYESTVATEAVAL